MTKLEKLIKAKELLVEVEDEFIIEKGYCPYEIGCTIQNIEEAIALLSQ